MIGSWFQSLLGWFTWHHANAPITIDPTIVAESVVVEGDFPRAQWPELAAYVRNNFEFADRSAAWTRIIHVYLQLVQNHLGKNYQVYEGQYTLLLSARGGRASRKILKLADAEHLRWVHRLGNEPFDQPAWRGKAPILLLETRPVYYDYLSPYQDPEEDWNLTPGTFLAQGIPHLVLNGAGGGPIEPALVHAYAHGWLARLHLPRWMDEGLAQIAEAEVRKTAVDMDTREKEKLAEFWRHQGLGSFWRGESFERTASAQPSYLLAQVLMSHIISAYGPRLTDLLKQASRSATGIAAAREILGRDLEDLVTDFLGKAVLQSAEGDSIDWDDLDWMDRT